MVESKTQSTQKLDNKEIKHCVKNS